MDLRAKVLSSTVPTPPPSPPSDPLKNLSEAGDLLADLDIVKNRKEPVKRVVVVSPPAPSRPSAATATATATAWTTTRNDAWKGKNGLWRFRVGDPPSTESMEFVKDAPPYTIPNTTTTTTVVTKVEEGGARETKKRRKFDPSSMEVFLEHYRPKEGLPPPFKACPNESASDAYRTFCKMDVALSRRIFFTYSDWIKDNVGEENIKNEEAGGAGTTRTVTYFDVPRYFKDFGLDAMLQTFDVRYGPGSGIPHPFCDAVFLEKLRSLYLFRKRCIPHVYPPLSLPTTTTTTTTTKDDKRR